MANGQWNQVRCRLAEGKDPGSKKHLNETSLQKRKQTCFFFKTCQAPCKGCCDSYDRGSEGEAHTRRAPAPPWYTKVPGKGAVMLLGRAHSEAERPSEAPFRMPSRSRKRLLGTGRSLGCTLSEAPSRIPLRSGRCPQSCPL